MITILKRGKAKLQLLKAAEKACDECQLCNASKQKKGPSGARTPEPADYEFNRTAGVDVIFVDDRWDDQQKEPPKETQPLLNIVCWGTGHQVVTRRRNRMGL